MIFKPIRPASLLLFFLFPLASFLAASPKADLEKPFAEAARDFDRGKYAEAARFYRIMMETYQGTDWEARAGLYLGQCYEKMGKPGQAVEVYRKVAGLKAGGPEAQEARFRLAGWLESQGQLEGAEREYRRLAESDPFSLQGILALQDQASLEARQGNYAAALENYGRLQSLDSRSAWAAREGWLGAARVYRLKKDYDSAVHALQQVVRSSGHDPAAAQALLLSGHCLEQSGKHDLAAQAYGDLARQYPDWAAEALVWQGQSLQAAGHSLGARDCYQRAIDLYPDTVWGQTASRLMASLQEKARPLDPRGGSAD
jgi:tetratricopeptide (TPR) repeat protein